MRSRAVLIIVLLSVAVAAAIFLHDGGKDLFGVRKRYQCLEEIADRVSKEPKLPVLIVGPGLGDFQMLIYMFAPCYVTDTPDASARYKLVVCNADKSDSVYRALRSRVVWYSRDCELHFLLVKNRSE